MEHIMKDMQHARIQYRANLMIYAVITSGAANLKSRAVASLVSPASPARGQPAKLALVL